MQTNKKIALSLVIALVVAVSLAFYIGAKFSDKLPLSSQSSQKWSAVTLSNGLIYFGQLERVNSQYVILKEAYFAKENPQKKAQEGEKSDQPKYLLTKVGETEVYGPSSTMKINRDHILFIQDLKKDSQVIKTIQSEGK